MVQILMRDGPATDLKFWGPKIDHFMAMYIPDWLKFKIAFLAILY